jgi:hypothetical protein
MKKYPLLVPFCNKYPLQRDIFCLERWSFALNVWPFRAMWSFAPCGWLGPLGRLWFGEIGALKGKGWLLVGTNYYCFATLAQLSLHSMLRKLALFVRTYSAHYVRCAYSLRSYLLVHYSLRSLFTISLVPMFATLTLCSMFAALTK